MAQEAAAPKASKHAQGDEHSHGGNLSPAQLAKDGVIEQAETGC